MTDVTATGPSRAGAAGAEEPPVSDGYRRYAIGLLFFVYVFNFIDRQIVTILAEPIKRDLGLADWQLGLMTGTAFAVFYCTLGIPIARLAERRNRPWIIGLSLAAWSGFTALCGLAQNFLQLVAARIGVGVGEAGCTPPAHSLIADYVPIEKRASAMALYSMGNPVGALIGVVVGGLVADAYGWRTAFLLVGAPGVAFAVLVIATLIEPRAGAAAAAARAAAPPPETSFWDVLRVLWGKRTFWYMAFAVSIVAFVGYGHAPFGASFFLRVHGDEIAALAEPLGLGPIGFVGLALGLILGVSAGLGVFLGGVIADRFGRKDMRAYMGIPAIALLVTVPLYTTAMLLPTFLPIVPLLALNAVLVSLWQGPVYATVQSIAPAHMRATAASIFLFIANLVGLGLGPLAVGLVSDLLAGPFGMGSAEGVRWALIGSQFLVIPAFWLFWMARRTIREEMEG
ncbi:MAG TPA: MFS transporter [Pseudomonadales bacterium]|nr:MFS transporter [Pseudomonadales bacterium]